MLDWLDFSGDSATETVALLISERSQSLVLAALYSIQERAAWKETDDATWDTIDAALAEAYEEVIREMVADSIPVGIITAFPSDTPPNAKWLYLNGQTVAQADYPDLYTLIGNFYTVPPITDMFKVPDFRDKSMRGATNGSVIGINVGSDTHALTEAELPAHNHALGSNTPYRLAGPLGAGTITYTGLANGRIADDITETLDAGGGGAHNNIPRSIPMAYMIKALP